MKKFIASFEGEIPTKTFHEFYAENEKAAWEKAKKIAQQSIVGLEYIMENPPEKPPEVLEVLERDEYYLKHFGFVETDKRKFAKKDPASTEKLADEAMKDD